MHFVGSTAECPLRPRRSRPAPLIAGSASIRPFLGEQFELSGKNDDGGRRRRQVGAPADDAAVRAADFVVGGVGYVEPQSYYGMLSRKPVLSRTAEWRAPQLRAWESLELWRSRHNLGTGWSNIRAMAPAAQRRQQPFQLQHEQQKQRDSPLPPVARNSGGPANVAALEPQTLCTCRGISCTALNSTPLSNPH